MPWTLTIDDTLRMREFREQRIMGIAYPMGRAARPEEVAEVIGECHPEQQFTGVP